MSIGDVGLRAKDEKKTNDLFKKKKNKTKNNRTKEELNTTGTK